MRRRLGLALAGAALGATLFAPGAFAASPDEACWGVVSAQLAQASGGLGNVARLFLGDDAKVYELGTLLASIDGLAETSCG